MRWTPWLALGMLACGSTSDRSPYGTNTLPPPSVESDEELSSNRRDFGGSISVNGDSAANFTIRANTNNGRVDVDVRSPTRADVTLFDGIEGQLSLGLDPLSDDLSVLVTDDAGDVRYLLETIAPTVLTDSAFASNFVTVGNSLGTFPVSATELDLTSVVLQTDDGEVEAFPGAPVEIVVDAKSFRFTLIASWLRITADDVGVNCSLDEILSYEVIAVEAGNADLQILERADTDPIDGNACLAPG